MKANLHHFALSVQDFDWYVDFFTSAFEMTVRKTAGEAPARKLWFHEGIQINETTEATEAGSACDHFSLGVADIEAAVADCIAKGCAPASNGSNWIVLPNGVKLEFMAV